MRAADNYFQVESDLRRAVDRDEFEVHLTSESST